MKVLHINTMLHGGGTDDQCVKLVAELRKNGVDARVIGPGGRNFESVIRQNNIPHIVAPANKLSFILAVAKELRHGNYDILHAHHGRDYWLAYLGKLLSFRSLKVVFTRHMAKSPSSLPSRLAILRVCDSMIAVSQFTAEVMQHGHHDEKSPEAERHHRPRVFGDYSKITVIHPGIDLNRFTPEGAAKVPGDYSFTPDNYLFAVVGGYDHPRGKGQREFLKAAARITKDVPHARFLIIGKGSLKTVLEEDIRQLGLEKVAFLTPYATDMPTVMRGINCLVHPSIGTEAYGLVLLEAFACGRPVIASNLDGIPEAFNVVGKGKLVPPEDIDALAAAMKEMAMRSTAVFSLEERWQMHSLVAANASLDNLATQTAAHYRQMLAR